MNRASRAVACRTCIKASRLRACAWLCRLRACPLDCLIGQATAELGQMVEARLEGADAGGGRAQLDDQGANLGLRDPRLDHVPSPPAGARVRAAELPPALPNDAMDPGRRVGR